MIPVKIDLGEKIYFIDLKEYLRRREYYDNLQIEATGKCSTKDIPYIEIFNDKDY